MALRSCCWLLREFYVLSMSTRIEKCKDTTGSSLDCQVRATVRCAGLQRCAAITSFMAIRVT